MFQLLYTVPNQKLSGKKLKHLSSLS